MMYISADDTAVEYLYVHDISADGRPSVNDLSVDDTCGNYLSVDYLSLDGLSVDDLYVDALSVHDLYVHDISEIIYLYMMHLCMIYL